MILKSQECFPNTTRISLSLFITLGESLAIGSKVLRQHVSQQQALFWGSFVLTRVLGKNRNRIQSFLDPNLDDEFRKVTQVLVSAEALEGPDSASKAKISLFFLHLKKYTSQTGILKQLS